MPITDRMLALVLLDLSPVIAHGAPVLAKATGLTPDEIVDVIERARRVKGWPVEGSRTTGYRLHLDATAVAHERRREWLQDWCERIY